MNLTSEESASLHSVENDAGCSASIIRWNPPRHIFLLKAVMAEKNLQSWSLDTSAPSLQISISLTKAVFLSTDTCLLDYWLKNNGQPNLGSVTKLIQRKSVQRAINCKYFPIIEMLLINTDIEPQVIYNFLKPFVFSLTPCIARCNYWWSTQKTKSSFYINLHAPAYPKGNLFYLLLRRFSSEQPWPCEWVSLREDVMWLNTGDSAVQEQGNF